VALIAFLTGVWLSLYMGWAIHSLRLIPRFTNTLLACCGKKYEVCVYIGWLRAWGTQWVVDLPYSA
jgi:hypothetical protein